MSCISGQVMLSRIVTCSHLSAILSNAIGTGRFQSIHSITELISSALPHAH